MTLRQRIQALMAHGGFDPVLVSAALDIDLSTVEHVLTDPAYTPAEPSGSGGAVVRRFPFAFDTPNILTGAPMYTPTVGEILLDGWIEINTAWDGTTPTADIGFEGGSGWFATFWEAVDMTLVDAPAVNGLTAQQWAGHSTPPSSLSAIQGIYAASTSGSRTRIIPATFTVADPIQIVVSQNGVTGGGDPGSTQGAAVVYLVTDTLT